MPHVSPNCSAFLFAMCLSEVDGRYRVNPRFEDLGKCLPRAGLASVILPTNPSR